MSELNDAMFNLLTKIRPNAVTLVDAFAITDRKLNSTLGRYDGQVYSALYDYAMGSPLNKTKVSLTCIYVILCLGYSDQAVFANHF